MIDTHCRKSKPFGRDLSACLDFGAASRKTKHRVRRDSPVRGQDHEGPKCQHDTARGTDKVSKHALSLSTVRCLGRRDRLGIAACRGDAPTSSGGFKYITALWPVFPFRNLECRSRPAAWPEHPHPEHHQPPTRVPPPQSIYLVVPSSHRIRHFHRQSCSQSLGRRLA